MVTGVKISELDEVVAADLLDSAEIPIVQAGVTKKTKKSAINPAIAGIGRATVEASIVGGDLDDLEIFTFGTIKTITGTNAEVIAANGPASGLDSGDSVVWHIFTIGNETNVTQMAFSDQVNIRKTFVRYGVIGSDAVFSAWFELGNKKLPRFVYQNDIVNDQLTVNQAGSINTVYDVDYTGLTLDFEAEQTYLFEEVEAGKVRYIGDNPAWFLASHNGTWANVSAGAVYFAVFPARNALGLSTASLCHGNSAYGGRSLDNREHLVLLQKYDELNFQRRNPVNGDTYRLEQFSMQGVFHEWAEIDEVMSAELFEPTTYQNASNCVFSGISGSAITATASAVGAATFEAAIAGLTIGNRYRVEIAARRGGSGTGQTITGVTFGTIASTAILTTSEEFFVFDVIATSTSGVINFTVDPAAAGGESLIISSLSVKEYL